MADLTYAQLEGLWLQTAKGTKFATRGWAALMAAIAEAESGGNPGVTNPNDNNGRQTSYGLWQISNGTHQPPAANWADPATNAQLALGKLQGQGLKAWGTYNSGAYRAYLSGSTTPDMSVPGNAAALTAETTTAQVSDCLYGFSGVPGTSWLNDITGGGGNIGTMCLLTRSQARGLAGGLLIAIGLPVMGLGVGLAFYEIGVHSRLGGAALALASRGVVQPPPPKQPKQAAAKTPPAPKTPAAKPAAAPKPPGPNSPARGRHARTGANAPARGRHAKPAGP